MARQYSRTQFFRRTPNILLGRYFQEKKNVLHEITLDELKENEVEPIFQAHPLRREMASSSKGELAISESHPINFQCFNLVLHVSMPKME